MYTNCQLCPNHCGVDRTKVAGICGQKAEVRVAWSGLHRGEEPPISGKHGSGMVFFSGCPLHCAYCQNIQISGRNSTFVGVPFSVKELAKLFLELQAFGAATLNLVTGTQFIPSIVDALCLAKADGLTLPVVWNSSGYEDVDALSLIDPYIDLYLMDVKTLDRKVASVFCGRESYVTAIRPLMHFITTSHPVYDGEHNKGVLVRHLVFPGTLDATYAFLGWYAKHYRTCTNLSLMVQFVPPRNDVVFDKVSDSEYDTLLEELDSLGIDGFVQERGDEILWIPDFREDVPFPPSFCDPLPYFLEAKKECKGNEIKKVSESN